MGMKTVFIISEYNPFHNGHAFQIQKVREELSPDTVIAIMSGNFLQRGSPAIMDKFNRAKLAIGGGCDLVLELPSIYATSSAEFFAKGGVSIANRLDPTGILSFGSESGDAKKIITVSKTLLKEKDRLDPAIRRGLDSGYSYPKARSVAFLEITGSPDLSNYLQSPNNTLAVEYVKAALQMNSPLAFHTVQRLGMGYHETGETSASPLSNSTDESPFNFPSATAMRNELDLGNHPFVLKGMPAANRSLFQDYLDQGHRINYQLLTDLVSYRLNLFPTAIGRIPEARDGLGERILNFKKDLSGRTLSEFALHVKTRRFTYSRICRLLLHLALGFDELDYAARRKSSPNYVRILALNNRGQAFLKETRKTRDISVVQSARDIQPEHFLPDLNASRLYSLLNSGYAPDQDFTFQLRVTQCDSLGI